MNLTYDRWKVAALNYRDQILTEYKHTYRKYKDFIPNLKKEPLTVQRKTLRPLFDAYDSMRMDDGIFSSIEDFLERPFHFLALYQMVKNWEKIKSEFPMIWLGHYNTWEKREIAHLRGQNALIGISIVDNLSSIVGFDFFTGITLKNYERMPSDFAYTNIKNATVSAFLIRQITTMKIKLLAGFDLPEATLCFPMDEVMLLPQLTEICRSNPEFLLEETAFSDIRIPELMFLDGSDAYHRYPGIKERDLAPHIYQDISGGKYRLSLAVSQYVPSSRSYRVVLLLVKDSANMQLLVQDSVSGEEAALKRAIEQGLAAKFGRCREEYETFYKRRLHYSAKKQMETRMESWISNFSAEKYFNALTGFYQKAFEEYQELLAPYQSHVPGAGFQKLYLFFIDDYGSLKKEDCKKALDALFLGSQAAYRNTVTSLIQSVESVTCNDVVFSSFDQFFEQLNHYFPLYHKLALIEHMEHLYPDVYHRYFSDARKKCEYNHRKETFRCFYSFGCLLSESIGYSFESAKLLPQNHTADHDSLFTEELFCNFQEWFTQVYEKTSGGRETSKNFGYGFFSDLSQFDFDKVIKFIFAGTQWMFGSTTDSSYLNFVSDYVYLDGRPLKNFEAFRKSHLADSSNRSFRDTTSFRNWLLQKISSGRHILDIPFPVVNKNGFSYIFLRFYDRTGLLPYDFVKRRHHTELTTAHGEAFTAYLEQLSEETLAEMNVSVTEWEHEVKKRHETRLSSFESDRKMFEKMEQNCKAEKDLLAKTRRELKMIKEQPAPKKPSSAKKLLSGVGMFKKELKALENEELQREKTVLDLIKRKEDLKRSIAGHEQFLENSKKAEIVLRTHKKYQS